MATGFNRLRETARFATTRDLAHEPHVATDGGTTTPALSHRAGADHRLTRSDLVPIQNLVLPTDVPPDARVGISLEICSVADIILPIDEKDICSRRGFNGFLLEAIVRVDGQPVTRESKCVIDCAVDARTFEAEFISGPSGTDHTVKVEVRGATTGNTLHEIDRTVEVRAGVPEPAECETNADCPSDQICEDGMCVEPPDEPGFLERLTGAAGSVSIVLALLVVLVGIAAVS